MKIEDCKDWLEIAYYISGIALVFGLFISKKQIKTEIEQFQLTKEDIKQSHFRANVKQSLELLDLFSDEIIPKVNIILDDYKSFKLQLFEDKSNPNSIHLFETLEKQETISQKFELTHKESFVGNGESIKEIDMFLNIINSKGLINFLNRLESFSAVVVNGLANEDVIFNPLSDTFCRFVEMFYLNICERRNENKKHYSNIVKLYQNWKGKINKQSLLEQRDLISEKISEIKTEETNEVGLINF